MLLRAQFVHDKTTPSAVSLAPDLAPSEVDLWGDGGKRSMKALSPQKLEFKEQY